MFIGHFFAALATVLHLIFTLYIWIVIARVVISWIQLNPYNPVVQFIYRATEPLLMRIRGYIPPLAGLDLSPVILIFAIMFLDRFLVSTLDQLSMY
jgi:YggT family protein